MSIRRTSRIRTATVLAAITAATLTGVGGAASAAPTAGAPSRGDSLPDTRAPGVAWPAELTEHTRLFVTPYRSYLVTIRDGVPTLTLSTGWDSCYFMTQHGQQRYPC